MCAMRGVCGVDMGAGGNACLARIVPDFLICCEECVEVVCMAEPSCGAGYLCGVH